MAFTKVAPAGIGSTPGDGYRIGDSFLHSTGVEITNINATGIVTATGIGVTSLSVAGVTTMSGNLTISNTDPRIIFVDTNNNPDFTLHANGGVMQVENSGSGTQVKLESSGSTRFFGNVIANQDLDVDGHTHLDNVSISGVTTTTGSVNVGGELNLIGGSDAAKYIDARTGASNSLIFRSTSGGDSNHVTMLSLGRGASSLIGDLTLGDSSDTSSAAGPEFTLNRNSASPANADYLGQIKFAGRSSTGVQRNYAKITGKILDVTNGAEDGILEFAHIKNGSQTITGRWRSDSLQLLNGTSLTVAGTAEITGAVTVSNNISLGDNDRIIFGDGGLSDAHVRYDGNHLQFGVASGQFRVSADTANFVNYAGSQTLATINSTSVTIPTKLGINGAAPQTPLDVVANSSGYAINVRGRSSDNVGEIRFTSNNYGSLYGQIVTGPTYLNFNTGGVQRLQLDASETTFNSTGADTDFRIRTPAQGHIFYVDAGNDQVCIKTSSAQSGAVLTVNGRTHINTQVTLGSNSTLDAGAEVTIYKPATNTLAFATAGANERLRITSGGSIKVGFINNINPTTVFDVMASAVNQDIVRFTGANYNRGLKISTAVSGSINDALIKYDADSQNDAGQHAFLTDGKERLRITSTGEIRTSNIAGTNRTYPIIGGAVIGSSDAEAGQFNYHDMRSPVGDLGGWMLLGLDYHNAHPYPRKAYKIARHENGRNGTRVYQLWHDGDANYHYGGMWEIRLNEWGSTSSKFESVHFRCINGRRTDVSLYVYDTTDGIWVRPHTIWGRLYLRRAGWDDDCRYIGSTYCAITNGAALASGDVNGTSGTIPSGYHELFPFDGAGGSHTGGRYIENNTDSDG